MIKFETSLDLILYIIEIFGVISFASSGAITAIRKKADVLGVIILTLIEIFGGGMLRDIILNSGVPHVFYDPEYLLLVAISIVIAIIWFVIAYNSKSSPFIEKHRHDFWIYELDAIGIAVFCVGGIMTAKNIVLQLDISTVGYFVLVTTCGVLTGVGGGMLRDIFVGDIPSVFKKHFYMTPCILGSLLFVIMDKLNCHLLVSTIVSVSLIIILRTLAIIYKWSLPLAKGYNALVESKKENK